MAPIFKKQSERKSRQTAKTNSVKKVMIEDPDVEGRGVDQQVIGSSGSLSPHLPVAATRSQQLRQLPQGGAAAAGREGGGLVAGRE